MIKNFDFTCLPFLNLFSKKMPKQRQPLAAAKLLVLSKCEIWDLVKEKALLKVNDIDVEGNDLSLNQLRFELILREIESLLSTFKPLTDKCLVKTDLKDCSIVIGPQLSRALDKSPEQCWSFSDSEQIGTLLNPHDSVSRVDPGEACLDIEEFEHDEDNDDLMLQISYLPLKFDVAFCDDVGHDDTTAHDTTLDDILSVGVDKACDVTKQVPETDVKKFKMQKRVEAVKRSALDHAELLDNDQEEEEEEPSGSLNQDETKFDPENYPHECTHCTRRYKSPRNLSRHQKSCNGVPPPTIKPSWSKNPLDGRYHCSFPGCSAKKTWTCSSGVWKHFNAEHADLKDESYCVYSCELCEKRFPTKTMYNQHRKHKHVDLFEFACDVCDKLLPSNGRLRLHMRQHTGEKPFGCDLCDYRSITQSAVNQHKMRMHEAVSGVSIPRHVCDICGKTFKVKSNLKEHIKSHSDIKTFLCGFCGKALKNRQCLNRHLFTHGVKYSCTCGKNFANQSSLNVHKRDKHGDNV